MTRRPPCPDHQLRLGLAHRDGHRADLGLHRLKPLDQRLLELGLARGRERPHRVVVVLRRLRHPVELLVDLAEVASHVVALLQGPRLLEALARAGPVVRVREGDRLPQQRVGAAGLAAACLGAPGHGDGGEPEHQRAGEEVFQGGHGLCVPGGLCPTDCSSVEAPLARAPIRPEPSAALNFLAARSTAQVGGYARTWSFFWA